MDSGMRIYQVILFVLTVLLGGLLLLDVLFTTLILSLGGYEMNPAMAEVVKNPFLHLAIKGAFAGFVIVIAGRAEELREHSGALVLTVACAFFLVVFIHNLRVFVLGFWS